VVGLEILRDRRRTIRRRRLDDPQVVQLRQANEDLQAQFPELNISRLMNLGQAGDHSRIRQRILPFRPILQVPYVPVMFQTRPGLPMDKLAISIIVVGALFSFVALGYTGRLWDTTLDLVVAIVGIPSWSYRLAMLWITLRFLERLWNFYP
jgi:hypothetical protein